MLASRLISLVSVVSFGVALEYVLAAARSGGRMGLALRTNGRVWFWITGVAESARLRTDVFIASRWRANGRSELNAGLMTWARRSTLVKVSVPVLRVEGSSETAR